jgi:hypothetical protein
MKDIVIEKVPALTCKKCGSIRVMMTDKGPECAECDVKPPLLEELEEWDYYCYKSMEHDTDEVN